MNTSLSSMPKKRGAPSPSPAPANKKQQLALQVGKCVMPSFSSLEFIAYILPVTTDHRNIVMNVIARTQMKNRIKLFAHESRFRAFIPERNLKAARPLFCREKMVIFNVSVAKRSLRRTKT